MGENRDEKFIEIFAEDLYVYLLSRRIGIFDFRKKVRDLDDVNLFTPDVGKAVLLMCHTLQTSFDEMFQKYYSKLKNDLNYFYHLCAVAGIAMYDDKKDDIFESMFKISAMILELVAFCHEKRLHFLTQQRAHTCWLIIFDLHLKSSFFEKGGWVKQKETAEKYARAFETLFEIPEAPGYDRVTIKWLRQTISFVSPFTSWPSNLIISNVIYDEDKILHSDIKLPTERSNLAQELNPLVTQKTELHPENKVTESNMPSINVMSEVQAVCSKVEYLNLNQSPTGAKSPRKLGAIPKTINTTKHSEKLVIELKSDEELFKSFSSILISEVNSEENDIGVLLSSGENKKLLMNDSRFLRLMKETVENPEKKTDKEKILEYAQRIITSYPEENLQMQDNVFPEIDKTLERKLDPEENLQKKFILETDIISESKGNFTESCKPLNNLLLETQQPFERKLEFSERPVDDFLPEIDRTFETKWNFEKVLEEHGKSRDQKIALDGKYELQSLSELPKENITKCLDLRGDKVKKSVKPVERKDSKLVKEQYLEPSKRFRSDHTNRNKNELDIFLPRIDYLYKFMIILNVKLHNVSTKSVSGPLSPNSELSLTEYADKQTEEAKIYLKALFDNSMKDDKKFPEPIPEDILTLKIIRDGIKMGIKCSIQTFSDTNFNDIHQLGPLALIFNPEEYSIEHKDIHAQLMRTKHEIIRAKKFIKSNVRDVNVSNSSFKTESNINFVAITELYNEKVTGIAKDSDETSDSEQYYKNKQDEVESFHFKLKEIKECVTGLWNEHKKASKLYHLLREKINLIPDVVSKVARIRSNPDGMNDLAMSLRKNLENIRNYREMSTPPQLGPSTSAGRTKVNPKISDKSEASDALMSIDFNISLPFAKNIPPKKSISSSDFRSTSLETSPLPLRLSDEYQLPGNRYEGRNIKTEMKTACANLATYARTSGDEKLDLTLSQSPEDGYATGKEFAGLSTEKNTAPHLRLSPIQEDNEKAAGRRKLGKKKKIQRKR